MRHGTRPARTPACTPRQQQADQGVPTPLSAPFLSADCPRYVPCSHRCPRWWSQGCPRRWWPRPGATGGSQRCDHEAGTGTEGRPRCIRWSCRGATLPATACVARRVLPVSYRRRDTWRRLPTCTPPKSTRNTRPPVLPPSITMFSGLTSLRQGRAGRGEAEGACQAPRRAQKSAP